MRDATNDTVHSNNAMNAGPVTDKPVCVTGASGFIASHIVQQLLQSGYRVLGTVRKDKTSYPFLTELPGADERLELVRAQLLDEGVFDEVVARCDYVLHTASPYVLDVEDPQKDLVEPAVNGTTNVLAACKKAGGVKRVVLTSSIAAITDQPDSSHVYTEDDWNDRSSLSRNPYYYSKTLAERAAWDYLEKEAKGAFELVVINPSIVIGPSLTKALNTSKQVFVDMFTGRLPGILNISWSYVDVRDVARAHILAMEAESAQGRNLCAAKTISMRDVVQLLRDNGYAGYKLPTRNLAGKLGDQVVKLGSYLQPKGVGTYLRTHIGRVPNFDNSKIQRELGLEFRPIEETILDTVKDLQRWGHVAASV